MIESPKSVSSPSDRPTAIPESAVFPTGRIEKQDFLAKVDQTTPQKESTKGGMSIGRRAFLTTALGGALIALTGGAVLVGRRGFQPGHALEKSMNPDTLRRASELKFDNSIAGFNTTERMKNILEQLVFHPEKMTDFMRQAFAGEIVGFDPHFEILSAATNFRKEVPNAGTATQPKMEHHAYILSIDKGTFIPDSDYPTEQPVELQSTPTTLMNVEVERISQLIKIPDAAKQTVMKYLLQKHGPQQKDMTQGLTLQDLAPFTHMTMTTFQHFIKTYNTSEIAITTTRNFYLDVPLQTQTSGQPEPKEVPALIAFSLRRVVPFTVSREGGDQLVLDKKKIWWAFQFYNAGAATVVTEDEAKAFLEQIGVWVSEETTFQEKP